jgi:hypothetical protein
VVALLRTVSALGSVAALVVTLAHTSAGSGFTGATDSSGNSVGTAADFCPAGGTTLTPSGDSWIDSAPSQNPNGSDLSLMVTASTTKNHRALVRFTLTSLPAACVLASAELRLYNNSPTSGRTIDVYRGDPTAPLWAEATVTWDNQPPAVGTAASSFTVSVGGWQTWTVTDHVLAHYAGTNNGLILRDSIEGVSPVAEQRYSSREGANPPELVLTWS